MSRYANAAPAYESTEPARPATDLESIRDQTAGRANIAGEMLGQIEAIVAKLRGHHPPSDKPAAPTPVPNGLLSEIRQHLQDADRRQSAALELLDELRALI
jgi:hypothetical protein